MAACALGRAGRARRYTITSLVVGVFVATTLRYFVTPQIVAKFEALALALRR
jgi:hypothetical protein